VNDLQITRIATIEPVNQETLEIVRAVENFSLANVRQVEIETEHLFHAGIYGRTITLPAGILLTNAFIKIPTILIVQGSILILGNNGWDRLDGYNVIPCSAGRKQVALAITDCQATMLFATASKVVEEAEAEFTDDHERLFSRKEGYRNIVKITGE
jgi:hypothetical protein